MSSRRSLGKDGSADLVLSRRAWLGLGVGGVLVVAGCGSDENEPDENEPDENEPDENERDENEPDEA